ncbi:MAG: FKBP-type peptidyl-prolyl cis-trans isomerase [Planctomycetota bacterium]
MKLVTSALAALPAALAIVSFAMSSCAQEGDAAKGGSQGGIPACDAMQKTASGLEWGVLKAGGDGPKPADGDQVKVHYTGWLTDGTKFDSSRDRGQPSTFGVNQVIPGWTEGLKLMTAGTRCKFIIPGNIAYGAAGKPPKIPGNATLVFDVELIEVMKMPTFVEPDAAKQIEITEGDAKGCKYEVVKAGEGAACADGQGVALRYAFWKEGQLLDCTERSGQKLGGTPDSLPLPFLKPLLATSKVGQIMRVAVPQAVWGRAGGDTVWEVELLSVNDIPAFRALDKSKIVKTDSGLQYEVLDAGKGDSPKATDTVAAKYTGWLTDGTLFDSAHARGEATEFALNRVIPGWTEGLQLMKPGAKFLFEIPAELGYGARATGKIPANAVLIFLVELESVKTK